MGAVVPPPADLFAPGNQHMVVLAHFDDGSTATSLTSSTDWTSLTSLEVELVAGSSFGKRDLERTMVMRFFPRNVLSN